jgi:hypothetical protein
MRSICSLVDGSSSTAAAGWGDLVDDDHCQPSLYHRNNKTRLTSCGKDSEIRKYVVPLPNFQLRCEGFR